jgi:hypothetical protein
MKNFKRLVHVADFCVVGGGMAGVCAALAAARRGARVVLMHDRPVLGGNASSECRVHICGADRGNGFPNLRETGILEELRLENLRRNPNQSFSIWDLILHEAVSRAPGLTLLLNCSCQAAAMRGKAIASVTGWQLTTQTYHTVKAAIFADCSGDGILAPLTGAAFRVGREARHEYGESIAPPKADRRTMGMTCLFQAREHATPQPFTPPPWACRFDHCEDLPYGRNGHKWLEMGYWWIELGGEQDSIRDTEQIRDKLLPIVLGVWDHMKNRCPQKRKAANWALDWLQFLPGKRESRRYLGAHVLTQTDIETGGRFPDLAAYGGWYMDDHHPSGFFSAQRGVEATKFYHAPTPYGIPYRCLYSRNIANLMFAGRDASCTHAAMSSTRVMGTGCSMGQAVGTAAALAIRRKLQPRDMLQHIPALQQALLADDCYLPGVRQELPILMRTARLTASRGDPEPVRDGINRPVEKNPHAWTCRKGDCLEYRFGKPSRVGAVTLILDSALDQVTFMSRHQRYAHLKNVPPAMPRRFRIEGLTCGRWRALARVTDNHQRLVRLPLRRKLKGIRFVLEATWGARETKVYAFYAD